MCRRSSGGCCCAWRRPSSASAGALALPGAGIHLVEATKQLYRPIPLRRAVRPALPHRKPALAPAAGRNIGMRWSTSRGRSLARILPLAS